MGGSHDPYRSFRFRLVTGGTPVAGAERIVGLPGAVPRIVLRKGEALREAHRPAFETVTLERGVTHDADFAAWAALGGVAASLPGLRRDILVELRDLTGAIARRWTLRNTWVSRYQAVPDLDANGNAVAIESLVLEHEGIED